MKSKILGTQQRFFDMSANNIISTF